jgi:prepilin-type N-terminal cleavage/methylation domain-containing protein
MYNKLMKMMNRKNKKGFTLVELMVVVVILGILVAIAVPVYNASTDKAKVAAIHANEAVIKSAISMYSAANDGAMPDTADLASYVPNWPTGFSVADGVITVPAH